MTELQGKIESNYHSQRLQYLSHIFSKWTNPNLDMVQLNSCYLSTTVEQTFSSSQGAFTKLDHIPDYKTHINKCKRLEIIPCMLTTIKLNQFCSLPHVYLVSGICSDVPSFVSHFSDLCLLSLFLVILARDDQF